MRESGETYHTWLCVGPPGKLRHTTKDVHCWALHEAQPSWIVFTKTRQSSTPYDSFQHLLILACWGSDLSHFALFNSWYYRSLFVLVLGVGGGGLLRAQRQPRQCCHSRGICMLPFQKKYGVCLYKCPKCYDKQVWKWNWKSLYFQCEQKFLCHIYTFRHW